jgi:hypothetical protein
MGSMEILGIVYLTTIVFAVAMTWFESRRSGSSRSAMRLAGYAACTVWPLVVMVFVFLPTSSRV